MNIILILLAVGLIINNHSSAWQMNLERFEDKDAGKAGNAVTNVVGALINLVTIIGSGTAIIMLAIIGIEYVSTGAGGKAEAKKKIFKDM